VIGTQGDRLGELFIARGLITAADLASALEKQKQLGGNKPLGELLVSMALITERDRVRVLGEQWGVEYIDLSERTIDVETAQLISQDLARRYKVIPLEVDGGKLKMAMKNPLDIFATDEIRLITGKEIVPLIATEEDIIVAIGNAYKATAQAVEDALKNFDDGTIKLEATDHRKVEEALEDLMAAADDAPIVKIANQVIARGIQDKASDIHIEPAKDVVKVRYRVDGILLDGLTIPKHAQQALISRIKIMADLDIAEKRCPQDGRISAMVDGKQFDFPASSGRRSSCACSTSPTSPWGSISWGFFPIRSRCSSRC
jgi:type IV pilus assembly protein PilB